MDPYSAIGKQWQLEQARQFNPWPGVLGCFSIQKIENGYLVQPVPGGTQAYYAADLKEAGEYITAQCVKNELGGK